MKKISILSALLVGTFIIGTPAIAKDVSNWSELKQALEDSTVSEINFSNNIKIDDDIAPEIIGNKIINNGNNTITIDGNNQDMDFTIGSYSANAITIQVNKTCFTNFENTTQLFYVGSDSNLNIDNSNFEGNQGKAIHLERGSVTVSNSIITGNKEFGTEGGIFHNNSTEGGMKILNSEFSNNEIDVSGGAIYTAYGSNLTVENTTFTNNKSKGEDNHSDGGGAIMAEQPHLVTIKNSTFENNSAKNNGGAIFLKGVYDIDEDGNDLKGITIIDSSFKNNSAENVGGAIYVNGGFVDIIADQKDVEFTGNKDKNGSNAIYSTAYSYDTVVNLNANANRKIVFNDKLDSDSENKKNTININNQYGTYPTAGTIEFNNEVKNNEVNLYNGTLKLGSYDSNNGNFDNTVNLNIFGGNVTLVDGNIRNTNLGNLTLNADMNLGVDANFEQKTMDTITVDSFNSNGHNINISNVNILEPTTEKSFSVSPLGTFEDENVRKSVSNSIQYTAGEIAYSPIYKYNATYDPNTAMLNFSQSSGRNASDSFNPAVLSSSVGAQLGTYLTQLNTYDQAFSNMDMLMLMTKEQRVAMKYANKYASSQGTGEGGIITFSPNQIPEAQRGFWFRPFATFENVGLKNGPNVKNIGYGSLFGGDSDLIELKHGWDMTYSLYAGYNGSNQYYNGVSIYQNGGTLGTSANWYKGNFFTGLTANVGANVGEASSMYGHETFTTLATGIASKTGYNWELVNGKFIVQPNFLMSYTFANTFDYTNAARVRISSDPLHAIQVAPGLKFIGNLKNGWQPYVGLQMVWNLIDKSRFYANNVSLPDMSVKPYFQYGVGVQKRIGERFTGFLQAMIRNGGRNGVALQFGFRWSI